MPISKTNRERYPVNWKAISDRIRFERAKGRCECRGECGVDHDRRLDAIGREVTDLPGLWHVTDSLDERCTARHGSPILGNGRGSPVVLTTAHRNHTPEECGDDNLVAMCQRCHLAYDREQHAASRAASQGGA